jgi:hypothetical protein
VFHALVRRYFHGTLKPPFNEEKRAEAGLPPDFYWPLAEAWAMMRRRLPISAEAETLAARVDRRESAEILPAIAAALPRPAQDCCGRLKRLALIRTALTGWPTGPAGHERHRIGQTPERAHPLAYRINSSSSGCFPNSGCS